MEARRQFIRYAITGGYALMIGAFYEVVFGWAWKEPVSGPIPLSKADAVTTIGGAVAVGFVLYQLYSAFDRPGIRLAVAFRAPRWMPMIARRALGVRRLSVQLFGTRDISGEVLDALHELPTARRALQNAYGRGEPDVHLPTPPPDAGHEEGHDKDANILNSVLNLTYSSGDGQIAKSYAALEDVYHALGACETALIAISVTAAVDILAIHLHAYVGHLEASVAVTTLALLLIWGSRWVIRVNRGRRRLAMNDQLCNDLRAWVLRHPQLLQKLADEGADR